MSEIDFKQIAKKFSELEEENQKLQHMKSRYVEYSKTLLQISDQLRGLARELDPVIKISNIARRQKDDVKEVIEDLYSKMKDGVHVTRDMLLGMGMDKFEAGNRLQALKILPGVTSVKDNGKLRLYYEERTGNKA